MMRMIRVVLTMFASVTNGITEKTRSLHDGSFNEHCVPAFPLFFRSGSTTEYSVSRPPRGDMTLVRRSGPYGLFGTIRQDFLAANVISCACCVLLPVTPPARPRAQPSTRIKHFLGMPDERIFFILIGRNEAIELSDPCARPSIVNLTIGGL